MVDTYTIKLAPVGEEIVGSKHETVLEALLRHGFRVFYGCTGGGCGTCKMRLISGRVDYGLYSKAVLSDEERQENHFLSCQARPLSDLEIEITEENRLRRVPSWHDKK